MKIIDLSLKIDTQWILFNQDGGRFGISNRNQHFF